MMLPQSCRTAGETGPICLLAPATLLCSSHLKEPPSQRPSDCIQNCQVSLDMTATMCLAFTLALAVRTTAACVASATNLCMKVRIHSYETGYYQFEGYNGDSPDLEVRIGQTYVFDQTDSSNWYHAVGFAYYPVWVPLPEEVSASAIDCKMKAEMLDETSVDHGNQVAVFMQQMIPHHLNAVNMAKILLKHVDAATIDAAIEEQGLTHMLNDIINVQNFQVHQFRNYLAGQGLLPGVATTAVPELYTSGHQRCRGLLSFVVGFLFLGSS
ncbi:unnamed protein product [Effrenium voratum]|nr:unnamed protein product [Effrenium voratum]